MFDELALKNAVLADVPKDDIPAFPPVAQLAAQRAMQKKKPHWYALIIGLIIIPIAAAAVVNSRSIFSLQPRGGLSITGFNIAYGRPTATTFRDVARSVSFPLAPPVGLPPGFRLVTVMVMHQDLVMANYWNPESTRSIQFMFQDPASSPPPLAKGTISGPMWLMKDERVILMRSTLRPSQLKRVLAAMGNP